MAKTPIPKRLREARKRAKLSQANLGVAAGMDPSGASARMNQYERDTHVPDYQTLKRIADVLETPAPFFYAEDDLLDEVIILLGELEPMALATIRDELAQMVAQQATEP